MKLLLLALCTSAFFLAQVAHAEPNGRALGYWGKDRISRGERIDRGPRGPGPSIPEPSAMFVFGAGLLAVGIANRRKSD